MDAAIWVALIGSATSVGNAMLQRGKEAKKQKDASDSQTDASDAQPDASNSQPPSEPKKLPAPRPTLVFVSTLAVGLSITALIIALLWVRSLPPPIQIESGEVNIAGSTTSNATIETPVKFKRPFPRLPVVTVHFARLAQGIDEGRDFVFEAKPIKLTNDGFVISTKLSYPNGHATVGWTALAQ